MTPQQQGQDLIARNRSLSSPMDTTLNGNESSNSTVSSSAQSPMTHMQHNTIMLNKIKDEPQHVPSLRTNNSSSSSIERISLEHNEVLKKEKNVKETVKFEFYLYFKTNFIILILFRLHKNVVHVN